MKVGFIGSGKVGTALGVYFSRHGIALSGYCDQNPEAAEKSASRTESKFYDMADVFMLITDSDVIMLTVQDSFIQELATTLSKLELPKGKTFVHTSGALESNIMEPLRQADGKLFSLHPLQAFADVEGAVQALGETWFFLEGESSEPAMAFLNNLPNPVRHIQSGKKAAYHAAAVVASNYLMVLLKFSQDLMVEAGVEARDALALLPLINSALDNFKNLGPETALTGPIARGDVETVAVHLQVLRHMAPVIGGHATWDEVYRMLGKATLDLAQAKQLNNMEQIHALSTLMKNRTEAPHEK